MIVEAFCENQNPLFDERFYDCLPKYCPECNMPMEMTETLTHLHCANPKCLRKVTQRLISMANSLGVKDLGESRAYNFIKNFGIENPLLIYSYEPNTDGQMADNISMELSQKIVDQFRAKNKFTLAEYVRIANLPYVQESANAVFGRFDSLEEAYEKIESGGVEYIRDSLSIKSSDDISVRALKVYDSLMTYKSDLFESVSDVEIINVNSSDMIKIRAVLSDEVGGEFRTKADFRATCNNLYRDIHIDFGNSVTKQTEYLVWKGSDGTPARETNKAKKAKQYRDQGTGIKLVTAYEFLQLLEDLSKGGSA